VKVVDAQVHIWERDSDAWPWDPAFRTSVPAAVVRLFSEATVSAEQLITMMDAAGVDAALLTSPGLYGDDHRYAQNAAARHPGRFGVVGPVTLETVDVTTRIAHYRDDAWGVGVRLILYPDAVPRIDADAYLPLFAAAERAGVPVFLTAMGMLAEVGTVARRFPGLPLILDHLGLAMVGADADRLSMVPQVLALAPLENVALKCSRVPELARTPYPFADLWPHLHALIAAFGIKRLMWGSDITAHGAASYDDALDYLKATDELSTGEKEWILGRSLRRVLDWPRS
jgi:L-fuconolactonase